MAEARRIALQAGAALNHGDGAEAVVTTATFQQPEPVETIFFRTRATARRYGQQGLSRAVLNNPAVTALLRGGTVERWQRGTLGDKK